MNNLKVYQWGRTYYEDALRRQQEIHDRNLQGEAPDTLILTEHWPVITLGRSSNRNDLLLPASEITGQGIQIFEVGRGGQITYHGPGQLLIYPIVNLKRYGRDLHHYCRLVEEVGIRLLSGYGIQAERKSGWPGIWVGPSKIASFGVEVKKWVTMHGMALNVWHNQEGFKLINPCGIKGCAMTSMENELKQAPDFQGVVEDVIKIFIQVFGYESFSLTSYGMGGTMNVKSTKT